MTESDKEELRQFLAVNWYQRDESDEEIVAEILSDESREYVDEAMRLIAEFIDLTNADIDKDEFIRDAVWRYVEPGKGAYINWLEHILNLLRQGAQSSGNGGLIQ